MKKENSVVLLANTISNGLIWPLETILAKKTTELVLLLHKNITKLVFLAQYEPKMLQSVNKNIISIFRKVVTKKERLE